MFDVVDRAALHLYSVLYYLNVQVYKTMEAGRDCFFIFPCRYSNANHVFGKTTCSSEATFAVTLEGTDAVLRSVYLLPRQLYLTEIDMTDGS